MARPASSGIGPEQFAAAVLKRLGVKQTPGAIQAMVGWERAEGGHWHNNAKYNPLNTTQNMPGSGDTGSQGNISVYRNWQQGVEATAKTLRNGRYGGIINALRSGSPNAVANAIDRSPWGTHGSLVHSAIAGAPRRTGVTAPSFGGSSGGSGNQSLDTGGRTSGSSRTTTTTTPGVDNSQQRAMAALSFLGNKNADVLDFASQIKQLQDVPGTTETRTVRTPGSSGSSAQTPASGDLQEGGLATVAARRADIIDRQRLPYSWGGGHGGKTPINKAVPLDCSGAVSKVLGIDPRVSGQFGKWGRPGDGGNRGVTIYSNGHHVLMKINNHFFGTSHTNPGGGAGWIPAGAISKDYLRGFTARHSNR